MYMYMTYVTFYSNQRYKNSVLIFVEQIKTSLKIFPVSDNMQGELNIKVSNVL